MPSVEDHEDIFVDSVFADFVLEKEQERENCQEYSRQVGKYMNYLVADFIIRIKNASAAHRKEVVMPHANMLKAIAKVLVHEGFLANVKDSEVDGKKVLLCEVRYVKRKPVVTEVEIISKPSLRIYSDAKSLHGHIRKNALTTVISTSQGVMTGKDALKKSVGGELLFKIG